MQLFFSKRFAKDYRKLPLNIQNQTNKQLAFLLSNIGHASLRTKLIQGLKRRIYEARITRNYRFTFQRKGRFFILRRVGQHNQVLRHP